MTHMITNAILISFFFFFNKIKTRILGLDHCPKVLFYIYFFLGNIGKFRVQIFRKNILLYRRRTMAWISSLIFFYRSYLSFCIANVFFVVSLKKNLLIRCCFLKFWTTAVKKIPFQWIFVTNGFRVFESVLMSIMFLYFYIGLF